MGFGVEHQLSRLIRGKRARQKDVGGLICLVLVRFLASGGYSDTHLSKESILVVRTLHGTMVLP